MIGAISHTLPSMAPAQLWAGGGVATPPTPTPTSQGTTGTSSTDSGNHSPGCSCAGCSSGSTASLGSGSSGSTPSVTGSTTSLGVGSVTGASGASGGSSGSGTGGGQSATDKMQQQKEVDTLKHLKQRDREVKDHEEAHLATAGGLAQGAPSFTYQRGSDGQMYAVGGSVSIDVMPVPDNPKATLDKARVIHAAALAPLQPSSQDQAVAAAATQMQQAAMRELSHAESAGGGNTGGGSGGNAPNGGDDQTAPIGSVQNQPDSNTGATRNEPAIPQSPASTNGMSPYVPNETTVQTPARHLQFGNVADQNSGSNNSFSVYA